MNDIALDWKQNMSTPTSYLRSAILVLLGMYLFVYPFGILLICLDIMPSWGTWMGGALLIIQGATLGCWLMLNYHWRGAAAALVILLLSWAVEHIGVTTGFPFGGYNYTDTLNLKRLGVVPLAVPFAWLLVIPSAKAMTDFLLHREVYHPERALIEAWKGSAVPRGPRHVGARFAAFVKQIVNEPVQAGVHTRLLTAQQRPTTTFEAAMQSFLHMVIGVLGVATFALLLDLLIEPVAVHINGYWTWDHSGGYYGVPGSNFAAWWVTSVVLAVLLFALTRSRALLPAEAEDTVYVGGRVYQWLPPLLYVLNLTMFSLVTLAHGKLFAGIIGSLLLFYLALAWVEPRLVRWIMGEQRSTTA
jgi:putative membrane protein